MDDKKYDIRKDSSTAQCDAIRLLLSLTTFFDETWCSRHHQVVYGNRADENVYICQTSKVIDIYTKRNNMKTINTTLRGE